MQEGEWAWKGKISLLSLSFSFVLGMGRTQQYRISDMAHWGIEDWKIRDVDCKI